MNERDRRRREWVIGALILLTASMAFSAKTPRGQIAGALEMHESEKDKRTARAMRRIVTLDYDSATLEVVLGRVKELSGAPKSVDWKGMAKHRVTPDSTLRIHVADVTAARALQAALLATDHRLGYAIEDGVLRVAIARDLPVYARRYDVRDLLRNQSVFAATFADAPSILKEEKIRDRTHPRPRPSGGLFFVEDGFEETVAFEDGEAAKGPAGRLIQAIKSTVDPLGWDGWSKCRVRKVDGVLEITQRYESHQRIVGFLNGLRDVLRARQAAPKVTRRVGGDVMPWIPLTGTIDPPRSAADRRVIEKLGKVLKEVDFLRVELSDAIRTLEDRADVGIHARRNALASAGAAGSRTKVTMRPRNVTAWTALRCVLRQASAGAPLQAHVANGVVVISEWGVAPPRTVTRAYDVQDLLFHGKVFLDVHRTVFRGDFERGLQAAAMVENSLRDVLMGAAEPNFHAKEDRVGVRIFQGVLLVTHTEQGQRAVVDFLNRFRAALRRRVAQWPVFDRGDRLKHQSLPVAAHPKRRPSDADLRTAKAMDMKLQRLHLDAEEFSDVLLFLRDVTGVNMVVEWPALRKVRVHRDTTVSLDLRAPTFRWVLDFVLDDLGASRKVAWGIEDGVLRITSHEAMDRKMTLQFHDVVDLVDWTWFRSNEGGGWLEPKESRRGGSGLFEDTVPEFPETGRRVGEMIAEFVDPDCCCHKRRGSLHELMGVLIIRQAPWAHEEIDDFLAGLRGTLRRRANPLSASKDEAKPVVKRGKAGKSD
jgi:hypothetical protein